MLFTNAVTVMFCNEKIIFLLGLEFSAGIKETFFRNLSFVIAIPLPQNYLNVLPLLVLDNKNSSGALIFKRVNFYDYELA